MQSMRNRVQYVFVVRHPLKIAYAVVSLVAVLMIYLWLAFWVWYERLRNQTMRHRLMVSACSNVPIPLKRQPAIGCLLVTSVLNIPEPPVTADRKPRARKLYLSPFLTHPATS
jgi:tellurite resistance protein TehA-like permease